jgi:hypothetical protein
LLFLLAAVRWKRATTECLVAAGDLGREVCVCVCVLMLMRKEWRASERVYSTVYRTELNSPARQFRYCAVMKCD